VIELANLPADAVVLELGGGDNPNPRSNINVDVRKTDKVHFTCDFARDGDWPEIGNESADLVYSAFCLEHVPYNRTANFLKNAYRIVKPGGKAIFALPNTEAQFEWIKNNPTGWDGGGLFEKASEVLMGTQDYPENTHKAFFNPQIAMNLFISAGFANVQIQPYNPRNTDMVVMADKLASAPNALRSLSPGVWGGGPITPPKPEAGGLDPSDPAFIACVEVKPPAMTREELYDKHYWNGGKKVGGYAADQYGAYRDFFPQHEITARHVLDRNPESVLEVGCLVEGSPIITDDGVKEIQMLHEGIKVYSHEGVFSEIERMSVRPYKGEIVSIEPRYVRGMPIDLTPDHPVFAVRVEKPFKSWKAELKSKPEWIPAGDLNVDDYWLVLPRPKKTGSIQVNENLARLGGYYLSEGWVQRKRNVGCKTSRRWGYIVSFCFHKKEVDYIKDVRKLMMRFFGTTRGWKEGGSSKGIKISFYSKAAYFYFKGLFGKGARNKNIPPEWISGASDRVLKSLMLGMYRGDGDKSGGRFSYSTASSSMAVSLRLMLMRLGILTELVEQEPVVGGTINGRTIVSGTSWRVRASGSQDVAASQIVEHAPRKSSDGRSYWYGRQDENYFYVPIKKLERRYYDGMVYNMDVREDHSYSHPACTVHNCARGYVLKRIQDAGIPAEGLEISKHCWMTRVANGIHNCDLCETPWPVEGKSLFAPEGKFDLCFSVAVLEHVPEEHLPAVIGEMERTCKRGLHGVDFGQHDDGFDKTHVTLKDKAWWIAKFAEHAPDWKVEVVNKELLEQGPFPHEVLRADGLQKLNLGSFISMAHHDWLNVDIQPCQQYAAENKFRFLQHDLKTGLSFCNTASVDLIFMHHSLEHLTREDAIKLLGECRRCMKPDAVMRIVVPDAMKLAEMYVDWQRGDTVAPEGSRLWLKDFAEVNDGVEKDLTNAGKFWALMFPGHAYCYDELSLSQMLIETGFDPYPTTFRQTKCGPLGQKILKETQEMDYGLSLFVEATPRMDV
jgi:predicted SAM-dependent methyltransferase/intein/homing endonuclease